MPRRSLAALALTTLLALSGSSSAQAPEYPAPYYVPVPYAYPVYVYVPVMQPPPPYQMLGALRYDRNPLDLSPIPMAAPSRLVVHQTSYRGPQQEPTRSEQPRPGSRKVGGFIFK